MTSRTRSLLAVLVLPAVLVLGACGADEVTSTSAPATADQPPLLNPGDDGAAADSGGAAEYAADGARSDQAGTASQKVAPQDRAVISKGQISLHTADIDQARFDLQKLLDTWDATIANERSDADDRGRTQRARFELRVPSPQFATAMTALADLGTLVERSRTSEDVTTQVIDIAARIRSQRLSLQRIEGLLARARDLTEIIAIETQLSRRQADLDSLEQQQKYLADQTSLATITVYLSLPDEEDPADEDGFWAGLRTGWENLGSATSATLTAVGTALPFAAALSLVVLPGWALWRRRRTGRSAAATPPTEP